MYSLIFASKISWLYRSFLSRTPQCRKQAKHWRFILSYLIFVKFLLSLFLIVVYFFRTVIMYSFHCGHARQAWTDRCAALTAASVARYAMCHLAQHSLDKYFWYHFSRYLHSATRAFALSDTYDPISINWSVRQKNKIIEAFGIYTLVN